MINFIIQGLLLGAIYSFIALSLTVIFGIVKIINFSHGSLLMVAMYISFFLSTLLGISPYIAAAIAAVVMFVFGFLIQRQLIQPVLRREKGVREPISALLLTAGLGIVLENLIMVIFGANYHSLAGGSTPTMEIWGIIIPLPNLYAFIIAFIASAAFYIFLKKTEMGRVIRAVGQDRRTAYLMGVNVERVYALCYGISCASLGVAGAVMLPLFYLHPSIGGIYGTIAFVTVVLGGLGSIPGAIIAGLAIGLIQSMSAMVVPNTLSLAVVFLIFLLFVFIRPQGILGSKHDW